MNLGRRKIKIEEGGRRWRREREKATTERTRGKKRGGAAVKMRETVCIEMMNIG